MRFRTDQPARRRRTEPTIKTPDPDRPAAISSADIVLFDPVDGSTGWRLALDGLTAIVGGAAATDGGWVSLGGYAASAALPPNNVNDAPIMSTAATRFMSISPTGRVWSLLLPGDLCQKHVVALRAFRHVHLNIVTLRHQRCH